jgi:hypothetical protein
MRNPFAWGMAAVALLATGVTACSHAEHSRPAVQNSIDTSGVSRAGGAPVTGRAMPSEASHGGAPTISQNADQGHVYRMKMIKAMDEHGFERPMVAKSMLVPSDWQSEGGVIWNLKPYDRCNTTQITLRANGPDGRGIEVFPFYNWVWDDYPAPLLQASALQAQFGTRPCDVQPPMPAADYIRRRLGQIRPGAQLVGIEPAPKIQEILERQARESEQSAARYGLRQSVHPDAARARLKYDLDGVPMEEWIYAYTVTTVRPGVGMHPQTLQMIQKNSYSCLGYMTAQRTPAGQLDASDRFFELLWSTSRLNPDWTARLAQHALAMQQIELKGIRDRSRIISQSANEIADMQMQGWQNRQRSEDRVSDSITESVRGVETYRNPATGETIDLSSEYGRAWVNNRGEYLVSDSPDFNPSVTLKEEWKPLERVRR